MVDVIWTEQAKQELISIFNYGTEAFSEKTARNLYALFISNANLLADFPEMGAFEPLLEDKAGSYRYIVVNKLFKLIYLFKEETRQLYILDIWDTRKSPRSLIKRVHP